MSYFSSYFNFTFYFHFYPISIFIVFFIFLSYFSSYFHCHPVFIFTLFCLSSSLCVLFFFVYSVYHFSSSFIARLLYRPPCCPPPVGYSTNPTPHSSFPSRSSPTWRVFTHSVCRPASLSVPSVGVSFRYPSFLSLFRLINLERVVISGQIKGREFWTERKFQFSLGFRGWLETPVFC